MGNSYVPPQWVYQPNNKKAPPADINHRRLYSRPVKISNTKTQNSSALIEIKSPAGGFGYGKGGGRMTGESEFGVTAGGAGGGCARFTQRPTKKR